MERFTFKNVLLLITLSIKQVFNATPANRSMGLPMGPEQSLTDQGAGFHEEAPLGQQRSERSN